MKIKCIRSFRDKTTAKNVKDQELIKVGDILTCDEELAKERIKKGFAIEVVEKVVEPVVEETTETEEVVEEVVEEQPTKKSRRK